MRISLTSIRCAGVLAAMCICALANPNTTRARIAGSRSNGGTDDMPKTAEALGVQYFPAAQVTAALQSGTPLLTGDGFDYRVLCSRHDSPGMAELHRHETDVFYIVDGAATFITGGTIPDPKETSPGEVRGTTIEGGVSHSFAQGDVIVIPAGTPHWFKTVPSQIHYFVVKVKTN